MIIGIDIRYFKTYQGYNYIPLTENETFCGLIGNNGIGKSSVLEALDCYFNGKPWIHNMQGKKSGLESSKPAITPIFLIEKSAFSKNNREIKEAISNYMWDVDKINSANKSHLDSFIKQRKNINIDKNKYYLLPLGIDYQNKFSMSFFEKNNVLENIKKILDVASEEAERLFLEIVSEVREYYQYIYIPKDIDPVTFTQLQTTEIQEIMGESLIQILSEIVPKQTVDRINTSLNLFLDQLTKELEVYTFRTPSQRQQNIKKNDIYSLIISGYFNIRTLHKKHGGSWIEMSDLSSGEKQKAIIEVTNNLLKNHRDSTENLIIAVDEPENSLHVSACFDLFLKIFQISSQIHQFIFSTHWYGFLPIIEDGCVTSITKSENSHRFDFVELKNYREALKQQTKSSHGDLPFDVRLKSINDFIQSIVTSILTDEPFNWIICEGSSEKIYFEHYFSDIKETKKLRIVPVGGAKEAKRIYEHLLVSAEEFKSNMKGKIFFIIDTDPEFVEIKTNTKFKNITFKRLINVEQTTKLVKVDGNPKSPATEIEDCLNGKAFYNVLKQYKEQYPDELEFVGVDEKDEQVSGVSLDLRDSEKNKLSTFFDDNTADNKVNFANKYIEELSRNEYKEMGWISEIRDFFNK